jgi:hypothetical protein
MNEGHFPPLCMLHAQKVQQAEQRQMDAAIKASKKAYDAQKRMQDIESNAVSPATTVGYFSSDDARSGLSSDGNESSGSDTSRSYRFVVAICCCPLGFILCMLQKIHIGLDTFVLFQLQEGAPNSQPGEEQS